MKKSAFSPPRIAEMLRAGKSKRDFAAQRTVGGAFLEVTEHTSLHPKISSTFLEFPLVKFFTSAY
jgi:hypothetical protein